MGKDVANVIVVLQNLMPSPLLCDHIGFSLDNRKAMCISPHFQKFIIVFVNYIAKLSILKTLVKFGYIRTLSTPEWIYKNGIENFFPIELC